MAFDERRGVTVLHGGWATYPNPSWSETWEWNGEQWTMVSDSGPATQYHIGMVYDSRRSVCVLFAYDGRTYEWDGGTWRVAAATGPPPRRTSALTFDSFRGVTVLFGGSRNAPLPRYLGDTWEYDGHSWHQVSTSGPAPRDGHVMTFDSARGVTILFGGGDDNQLFNDTWEWDGKTWKIARPCYADCDTTTGEGILDIFDFLCFGNRFAANDPYACDCDLTTGLGVCDIFDFLCFGNAFNAGCP